MKVRLVDNYSVALVKAHPNEIFVFGDNLARKGVAKGAGQAVIRYQLNAIGIATKRLPSSNEGAYFSDLDSEIEVMKADLRKLYMLAKTHALVFPSGGIGTGRAEMHKRSPKAWACMNKILRDNFGIENGKVSRLVDVSPES